MGKNYWSKGRRYDFFLSGPSDKTRGQLSALRMELATRLGLRNPAEFAPLWVVDFPLLELDEESGRWHAMHHPFIKTRRFCWLRILESSR
jgi:aspartyl-tRNA synthetase